MSRSHAHWRLALASLAVLLCAALGPTAASAQSASEVAAARRLFRDGVAAARAGEWTTALDHFERSYAIAPRASTLLNMAGAQAQTGRLVAATESYERFLAEATDRRSRRLRPRAESELADLRGRLAHVVLTIDNLAERDQIRYGDQEISQATLGVDLPVDPGARDLVVTRGGDELLRETLDLAEGERRELEFSVDVDLRVSGSGGASQASDGEVPPGALATDGATEGGGDDTGVIVGVTIGVVLAVVAAAIIIGVVVADGESQPFTGNLGDGMLGFE